MRSANMLAISGIALALGSAPAYAHVSAQPEEAEKGGYAKIAFRVPNEDPVAGTVQVKVTLPEQHPLSSVRTKPVPGWTAQVEKAPIPPVTVEGAQVTEAVRTITWTAQPGTRIGPNEFNEFEVTLGALPENTDQLVMPATQTYDNGKVVEWNQPQPPGGEEPEHPAPTVKLIAAEGDGHSHGGASSEQGGQEAADQHGSADDTARYLGGAGLLVGALGLGVGAGALVRGRRSGGDAS
ncbi:YcnI family copper-binding membrane protein [Saccharopolyspora mangrovi]|uniref:YcnI family protein n=1 Tax=Saccharopolyspora mangrovi TaxID=3082379 RepID=A0ABU6AKE8_9PSEU|nr:YcnI family protein [Saccharopolyspora sp. S2-29]MEB3372052.1 YcnI family protein [Saccharopolyspora sp. S2-29]